MSEEPEEQDEAPIKASENVKAMVQALTAKADQTAGDKDNSGPRCVRVTQHTKKCSTFILLSDVPPSHTHLSCFAIVKNVISTREQLPIIGVRVPPGVPNNKSKCLDARPHRSVTTWSCMPLRDVCSSRSRGAFDKWVVYAERVARERVTFIVEGASEAALIKALQDCPAAAYKPSGNNKVTGTLFGRGHGQVMPIHVS